MFLEPPSHPVIAWEGRVVKAIIGPLRGGVNTRLTCRSTAGEVAPSVTWWRSGTRLPHQMQTLTRSTSEDNKNRATVKTELKIVPDREMYGAALLCQVTMPKPLSHLVQPFTVAVSLNITCK